ncbi:MAG TPA: hypothetical protein O0X39_04930 [Methanocorpusculum sp.]|nr:hypothetical protein [Methanocorpusculum sp.]
MSEQTRDPDIVYCPTNDELRKGCAHLSDEVKAYYLLSAACGARASQFFAVFESDPSLRDIRRIKKGTYPGMESDVVIIDTPYFTKGNARMDCFCFPPQLEAAVRSFTLSSGRDYYLKTIRFSQDEDFSINASCLREWNYAVIYLEIADRMNKRAKDVIKGTYNKKIRAEVNTVHGNIAVCQINQDFDHDERVMRAVVAYSKAAKVIFEELQVPEYILKGKVGFVKDNLSPIERAARQKKVISMLKAKKPDGKWQYSHRAIKIETGISSRELNRLIEENGLERGNAGGRAKGMAKPRKAKKE